MGGKTDLCVFYNTKDKFSHFPALGDDNQQGVHHPGKWENEGVKGLMGLEITCTRKREEEQGKNTKMDNAWGRGAVLRLRL